MINEKPGVIQSFLTSKLKIVSHHALYPPAVLHTTVPLGHNLNFKLQPQNGCNSLMGMCSAPGKYCYICWNCPHIHSVVTKIQ